MARAQHKSGRIRKSVRPTKRRSYYEHGMWAYSSTGERWKRPLCRSEHFSGADLINTALVNPATNTRTVHCLTIDLDWDKADAKWLDAEGRLDWHKIGPFLRQTEGPLFRQITEVCRSTSGRGLGLAIAVSPFEIVEATRGVQRAAVAAQRNLIEILNFYRLGADPSAIGLVRDMPNYRNPKKLVDELTELRRHVDNQRVSVIGALLAYSNKHPAVHKRKKEDTTLLWPDSRVEIKLALLVEYLFDEALESDVYMSYGQLLALTKISPNVLKKILRNPPRWLGVERINKFEGYRLWLKEPHKIARARDLLDAQPVSRRARRFLGQYIPQAEEVEDGERNDWIADVALQYKHAGIGPDKVLSILARLIPLIPGHETSRNCRQWQSIVRSIYANHRELFGIRGTSSLCPYLEQQLDLGVVKFLPQGASREKVKKHRRGGSKQGVLGYIPNASAKPLSSQTEVLDFSRKARLIRPSLPGGAGELSSGGSWELRFDPRGRLEREPDF